MPNTRQVIACVGETLAERESNSTLEVIFRQLQAVADEIDDREHSSWGAPSPPLPHLLPC
jgi:triosephosphate isomerase